MEERTSVRANERGASDSESPYFVHLTLLLLLRRRRSVERAFFVRLLRASA